MLTKNCVPFISGLFLGTVVKVFTELVQGVFQVALILHRCNGISLKGKRVVCIAKKKHVFLNQCL